MSRGRTALLANADLLHEYADALERRIDGDPVAFTDKDALALIQLVIYTRDALAGLDALVDAGRVIRLDDRRKETP